MCGRDVHELIKKNLNVIGNFSSFNITFPRLVEEIEAEKNNLALKKKKFPYKKNSSVR